MPNPARYINCDHDFNSVSRPINIPTPVNAGDAVNKAYADALSVGGVADGDKGDIVVSSSGTVWTIDSGVITNAKVASGAGIVYSKLNLAGSIVNADIHASAAIGYAKLALAGSIVDADVNASAAIGWSKVSKSGSSLADLATRSAGDLASGTLADARLSSNIIFADGTRAFTAPVGGIDPTSSNHFTTKSYVDALAFSGIQLKQSVRVATTANLTLSGAQTIDGVSCIAGDRVLVKNQSAAADNGLYVVAAGAWSRATDADTSAEVKAGLSVWVNEGTANGDSQWVLTTNDPITLGTDALVFTQVSGLGQVGAGQGLTKSGNTLDVVGTAGRISVGTDSIDIDSGYVGQASITTLGTIATGTWNATAIALNKIASVTASRALVSDGSGFISASSVTATELGHLSGVTSALQTQINGLATTALGNLASVAIATALLPASAAGVDFGSATKPWKDIWLAGSSGTPASNNFRLTGTATAARVVTFPDATFTVVGSASALTSGRVPFATAGGLLTDSANLFWDNSNNRLGIGTSTPAGALDINGMLLSTGLVSRTVQDSYVYFVGGTLASLGAYFGITGKDYAAGSPFGASAEFVIGNLTNSQFALYTYNPTTGGGHSAKLFLKGSTGLLSIGGELSPGAQLHLTAPNASTIAQIIKGAVNQSADYLNVNTSSGSGGDVFSLAATGVIAQTVSDATTNAVATVKSLRHNSTGTAADGFGSRFLFSLESSTTVNTDAAAIDVYWKTATHASRTSALAIRTVDSGGALTEVVTAYGSKVGILQTAPTYELDVTGSLRATVKAIAPLWDKGGEVFNVLAYGAVGDAIQGTCDCSGTTLTLDPGTFTQWSGNKTFYIRDADTLVMHVRTGTYLSSTTATLNSSLTLNNATVYYGTDNTSAFAAAMSAASAAGGGTVFVPAGKFIIATLDIGQRCTVRGAGPDATFIWSAADQAPSGTNYTPIGIFNSIFPSNTSTQSYTTLRDLTVRSVDILANNAGLYDNCGSYTRIINVKFEDTHFGVIADQSEILTAHLCNFQTYTPITYGGFCSEYNPTSGAFTQYGTGTFNTDGLQWFIDTTANTGYYKTTLASTMYRKGFTFWMQAPTYVTGSGTVSAYFDNGTHKYTIEFNGTQARLNGGTWRTCAQGSRVRVRAFKGGATANFVINGTVVDTAVASQAGSAAELGWGHVSSVTAKTGWYDLYWMSANPLPASFWLVDGAELTTGNSSGYTNSITIEDCQFNTGATMIAGDGGQNWLFLNNTYNSGFVPVQLCAAKCVNILGGGMESSALYGVRLQGYSHQDVSATPGKNTVVKIGGGLSIQTGAIYGSNPIRIDSAGTVDLDGTFFTASLDSCGDYAVKVNHTGGVNRINVRGCVTADTSASIIQPSRLVGTYPQILSDRNDEISGSDESFSSRTAFKRLRRLIYSTSVGSTYTIDLSEYSNWELTLTANCTFTITNLAQNEEVTLILKQDGTGSRTVTWPSSVKWKSGTAPTLTTTAGRVDIVKLVSDGTRLYELFTSLNLTP